MAKRAAAVRMEALAVLPVFLKLAGKRAVLAGGSTPAVWKTELLSAAGADVVVFAEAPCPELIDLANAPPGGVITLVPRAWTSADLAGAAVAIGAIEEDEEAEAFQGAARAAGVPVNVIDKPAFCDFQFGTVVSRSPLVIGISTDGAAPVFGQAIRARIEALLPQGLKAWAEAARDWRSAVQALNLDFRARRRFWEVFAARALRTAEAAPDEADRQAALAAALGTPGQAAGAELVLVGAGTGDPDTVTLAAIRALQDADVILHGPEASATVVGFGRREASKVPVRHRRGEALPEVALAALRPGRRVAWVDAGDPEQCRRWFERADQVGTNAARVWRVGGLGRCRDCSTGCPAWTQAEGP